MKLPKIYEPQQYETDIYALWEKSGAFVANPELDMPRFSISMPPPNETGTLSLGHALFLTLQDISARYNRQKGKDVLWLPGTDHAALAVNAIIEKKLAEEGTDKHAVGREEFLRRTREFVSGSRNTMLGQMRAMGASCDWTRLKYTLDDSLSRCVNETFTRMYNDAIIYRGFRIVNWDPNLETTVSDDEVEHKEEQTNFYTFQYGPFKISTTRPETKFGDKYVVMHPDDERYAQYNHGDTFEADWLNGRVTAIIIKDEAVDPAFGTGVMTITPWHDITDFEIAERHGLDKEQVIDFHGNLLPIAQEFCGMPIAEARPKIVAKLKEKGLLVAIDKKYMHSIAINERGKGIIEPQIKLQWFVDVNKKAVEWKGKSCSLKEVMRQVVHEDDISILPERFEKTYLRWIDNLHDWCISRQIWWGHRVPVWYRTDTDGKQETYVGMTPPTDDQSQGWNEWEQDPDTLDTWFSSALWTWSTLVDPALASNYELTLEDILKQSKDYQTYHPTTFMETGWDILPFWVSRMILATTYMTGQVPFKTVYLHGMVRAADGKKMSKSRPESIIDPLGVIEKYGADALRMALIMGVSPGNDQNWGWGKIEANRNFCNKLWNIARYVEDKVGEVGEDGAEVELGKTKPETAADHWILYKLQRTSDTIDTCLGTYQYSEAYDTLYHFVWDDFADWYIEASKANSNREVLAHTLESILRLAHPFAPFVTETIWQTLSWQPETLLATSGWPVIAGSDQKSSKDFETIKSVVSEVRYLSRVFGVTKPTLYFKASQKLFERNGELITKLANLDGVIPAPIDVAGVHLTQTKLISWLDIDITKRKKYLKEIETKRDTQEKTIVGLQKRLANKQYVDNAPEEVVAQTETQLEEAKVLLENIIAEHDRFEK